MKIVIKYPSYKEREVQKKLYKYFILGFPRLEQNSIITSLNDDFICYESDLIIRSSVKTEEEINEALYFLSKVNIETEWLFIYPIERYF